MSRTIVFVCALCAALGLVAFGDDAEARPTSWKPFCGQLAVIKKTSETGGWNKGPNDPYGLKAYDADYARLKRISPSTDVAALLTAARPLFSGVVADTKRVRTAIPAAKKLRPIVLRHCNLEVGDVFKVGF